MDEEKKVKVSNWDINYLKVGNGPHTVFCMPATFGSIWTHFKRQVEGFDREQFTLVVWDPPGYGKSRPPERESYPVDFYENDADFAYEFLKALRLEKVFVLGWCGGGMSAMILAAKHPEVVHKLVVWAVSSFLLPQELDKYKSAHDLRAWPKMARDVMLAEYGVDLLQKYVTIWTEGLQNLYNARGGDICSGFLEHIRCPTLILYGEKDSAVDKSHIHYLRAHIEDSRVHLYPDGGHAIHISLAVDFNVRVQQFLSEPSNNL